MGSTPDASGSSVPPWPTLVLGSPASRSRRLTAATVWVDPRPSGLSRTIQPWSILLAGEREAHLPRLALAQPLEEMAPAERHIAVVAADFGLRASRDRMALGVDAEVHG